MEKRPLGTSGLEATLVGLGCNNFGMKIDLAASRAVVNAALDAGITFFDTADMYGNGQSEEFIGQVLGPRRKEVVLATKFGGVAMMRNSGERWGTRTYLVGCLEASLQRLGTEWIDLYQIHYPDPTTPIEETLAALDDLVHQGKVRAVGCSNLSGAQIAEATSPKRVELAESWGRTGCNPCLRAARSGTTALLPAGQWDADGQVSAGRGVRHRDAPGHLQVLQGLSHRRELHEGRGAAKLRRATRAYSPRTGGVMVGRASLCCLGHRRCDDPRAGACQCRSGELEAVGCRARGGRCPSTPRTNVNPALAA